MKWYPRVKGALDATVVQDVSGLENIPDSPVMLVSNHQSFLDSLLISSLYTTHTGKPLRFAAQKEYFDGEGLRVTLPIVGERRIAGQALKWLVEVAGSFPVDRQSRDPKDAIQSMIDASAAAYARGESTGAHPEGTRSKSRSQVYRFRGGAIWSAVVNEVPIVPVSINMGWTPHLWRHARVRVGEPMTAEHLGLSSLTSLSSPDDTARVREYSREVQQAVAVLGDLEAVDQNVPSKK